MTLWHRFRSWLRGTFQRSRIEREMDAELRFHIDAYADDLVRAGVPREEAVRRARIEFGGIEKTKEECREARALSWLGQLWRDIRFGLRLLMKSPGFTATAIIALALGIGADTAMYTIVNGALSWDLGLDNRDQIVMVRSSDLRRGENWGVSYPDFRDLRAQVKSLAGLAAYQLVPVNVSDESALPERYYCVQMSANGFSVVQHKPLLGRDFIPADEQPGAPPVLMLGYHVWRDRYGQDPDILGKTVRVDEVPRAVIGVMPPGRRFPEDTDLWVPLIPDAASEKRDSRELMLFGRLRDGVGVAKARTEVAALSGRLAAQYPDTNKDITADVRADPGDYRRLFYETAVCGVVCRRRLRVTDRVRRCGEYASWPCRRSLSRDFHTHGDWSGEDPNPAAAFAGESRPLGSGRIPGIVGCGRRTEVV